MPNIPPVVKGNDFYNYTSLTNTPGDIMLLRMSLGVATRQLTTFKSSQAFVNAVADATEGKVIFANSDHMTNCFVCAAHQQAYFGAHILHCDFSVNNILITDEDKGLLVDWDLSLHLNNGDKPLSARQLGRTVSAYLFAEDLSLSISTFRECGGSCQLRFLTIRNVTNSRTPESHFFIS